MSEPIDVLPPEKTTIQKTRTPEQPTPGAARRIGPGVTTGVHARSRCYDSPMHGRWLLTMVIALASINAVAGR